MSFQLPSEVREKSLYAIVRLVADDKLNGGKKYSTGYILNFLEELPYYYLISQKSFIENAENKRVVFYQADYLDMVIGPNGKFAEAEIDELGGDWIYHQDKDVDLSCTLNFGPVF